MIYLACFLLGFVGGMVFTMWKIGEAVEESDLCSDDRRIINDTLGIPND